MQFFPTEEQKLLKDAVRRFVARTNAIRQPSQMGHDQDVWSTFAEQGWLAAGVREELGGIGEGSVAVALIAEELGRGLIPEAYVPVAVVSAQLLVALAPDHALLQAMMAGHSRPVLAHFEAAGRGDETWVQTSGTKRDGSYVLNGAKTAILGGPAADVFLVSARVDGDPHLSLFAVGTTSENLKVANYRTVDNRGASHITLKDVHVGSDCIIGLEGAADAAIQKAVDCGLVVAAAEAVGAIDSAFDMTRAYLKTRSQFGRLIGDFQALRHRLADMFIESEQARSIVMRALAALESDDAIFRSRLASAAKVRVAQAGRYVTAQAIQLHGGIGMTEEFRVGHYFKRLMMFTLLNGSDSAHLQRYTRLTTAAAAGEHHRISDSLFNPS